MALTVAHICTWSVDRKITYHWKTPG